MNTTTTTNDKTEQAALAAEYLADIEKNEGRRWADYARKTSARFVRISSGIVAIEKPRIETRFCFSEDDRGQGGSGPGTLAYAARQCRDAETRSGFIRHNLDEFDRGARFKGVGNARPGRRFVSVSRYYSRDSRARYIEFRDEFEPAYRGEKPGVDLSESDLAAIRDGFAVVRAAFVRRLETWWKRYGADHVTTWTYWANA
jgi:hypothetical protein